MPSSKTREPKPSRSGNRLLDRLPDEIYAELAPHLSPMQLKLKQLLIQPKDQIRDVFFPTTAVVSSLVVMENGSEVETGITGAEGFVGLSIALGLEAALHREICQVPGESFRLPAQIFVAARERSRPLDALIRQYSAVMLRQTGQGMACNALHPVTERLCRWLLMSHDRVGKDEFPMTQEFMGDLLGVRRQSVTVAAGILQQAGLITFKRGSIRIVDRGRLEEAACECYWVIRRLYDQVFP
jgi:CRP-like cAMP-binding protein